LDNQLPEVELISSTAQGSLSSFPFSETADIGVFVNATMTIAGIETNTIDLALIALCPIFACFGVLVSSLLKSKHAISNNNIIKRFFTGVYANIAHLFIGLVVGLVIALFFVGAINNDISSLARVLVLTVFLGYHAPLIWVLKSLPSDEKSSTAKPKPVLTSQSKTASVKAKASNPQVALDSDLLKQERLKRAKLKLAEKS
jgi:hypothetical protein